MGAQDVTQQYVARLVVEGVHTGHTLLALNMNFHTQARGCGCGDTNIVGLHGPGYDDGIRAFRQGGAKIEFQLARLIDRFTPISAESRGAGSITVGRIERGTRG